MLHVSGRFSGIEPAQEVRTLVREGIVDSMSVVLHNPTRKRDRDGVTHATSGELLSVDFVSIPSNVNATVTSARGFGSGWRDDDPNWALLMAVRAQIDLLEVDLASRPRVTKRSLHPAVTQHPSTHDGRDNVTKL